MSSAIIMNLAAIAAVVTGWTTAVAVFCTRLDDTRALRRTTRTRELTESPAARPQPEPALAGAPA